MKIAILVSGQPRFHKMSFYDHLTKFKGYSQVDWFFYIWKNNENIKNIPPEWINISDVNWAVEKIKKNLPVSHILSRFHLGMYNIHEYHTLPSIGSINAINLQFYSLKQADLLRQETEQTWGNYDLVVRTRLDREITKEINLIELKNKLDYNPNLVFTPNNYKHYYNEYGMCDAFAITSSKNMSIYSDLINFIPSYYQQGLYPHPESLLNYHLIKNSLELDETLEINQSYSYEYVDW